MDGQFDTLDATRTVPEGWELRIDKGTYETGVTTDAVNGKALGLAGSGGSVTLMSNLFSVAGDQVLDCELWHKSDSFDKAKGALGVYTVSPTSQSSFIELMSIAFGESEYRRTRFFYAPADSVGSNLDASAVRLAVRLVGDGLVRLDSVSARSCRVRSRHSLTTQKQTSEHWRTNLAPKGELSIKDTDAGTLVLEGNGEWAVAMSPFSLPTSASQVYLQGMVRAEAGDGHLKIEYWRGREFVDHSFSEIVTDGHWQIVGLEVDPVLAKNADTLRFSVGVGGKKDSLKQRFKSEFRHIEVWILDE